jgi:hypothetical protein
MKLWGLTLNLVVGLAGCVSHPSSQAPDVFSGLVGNWDEEHPDSCKNPHVISFDDEKTTMFVTYADVGWLTENDSRTVFRYEILSSNQSAFRTQLENEPRLDNEGKPVVWHIVLVDGDTYCWGRDDWPQGACTPPRKRCAT